MASQTFGPDRNRVDGHFDRDILVNTEVGVGDTTGMRRERDFGALLAVMRSMPTAPEPEEWGHQSEDD